MLDAKLSLQFLLPKDKEQKAALEKLSRKLFALDATISELRATFCYVN